MTQALRLSSDPNGPLLQRGPAYLGFVAVAARLVELVFADALINERPGGLMIDHMLAGMRGFVPELPVETHLQIIQAFVRRRRDELAGSCPTPISAPNVPLQSAQRLKETMLSLKPDVQRHVMVNFVALVRRQPVIGKIHPLAKLLKEQPEEAIKGILEAMVVQAGNRSAA